MHETNVQPRNRPAQATEKAGDGTGPIDRRLVDNAQPHRSGEFLDDLAIAVGAELQPEHRLVETVDQFRRGKAAPFAGPSLLMQHRQDRKGRRQQRHDQKNGETRLQHMNSNRHVALVGSERPPAFRHFTVIDLTIS